MSIATDVSRIKGNITAALAAIAEKGVTVPDGSTSDALAGLIASIEAGGGDYGPFSKIIAGTFTPAKDTISIQLPDVCYTTDFILAISYDVGSGTVTSGHFRIGLCTRLTRVSRYYSSTINGYFPDISDTNEISFESNGALQAGITYRYIYAVKE